MIRVLLADDEPLVLIGMQSMLDWAALGYELVGTARNGGEALEKIRDRKRSVGVISHVEEIKARIPVRLIVEPSRAGEGGSKIHIERE